MPHLDTNDYEIKVTMTIKASILQYFSQAEEVLKTFEHYLNRHRELDFLKMRGFLRTTYNSLNDIDHNFKSKGMVGAFSSMEKVGAVYDDFAVKSSNGSKSYYVVFLQQQERYTLFESLLQNNLDEIKYLREQALGFKENVQKKKDELGFVTLHSANYNEKQEQLKQLKRRENTTLVRMGEVKEQNEIIDDLLSEFRDTYQTQFNLMYDKYTQTLKPRLLTILNAMAFEFDIKIWLQANNSAMIKTFFQHTKEIDTINSKTYLSYYLKHLDQSKLNEEHRELQTLLEYLNESTPINCVIYMPDEHELNNLEKTLLADDNGLLIHAYCNAKVALVQTFSVRINILILDLEADESILENFLSLYRKNSKQLQVKAKIMLMCNEANQECIAKAELLGADSLMEKGDDAYAIIDTVYDLLKIESDENEEKEKASRPF